LYDDFLDADDKQQSQTSKLGNGTTDTSKSLYDREDIEITKLLHKFPQKILQCGLCQFSDMIKENL
jgi:hypothetical protein